MSKRVHLMVLNLLVWCSKSLVAFSFHFDNLNLLWMITCWEDCDDPIGGIWNLKSLVSMSAVELQFFPEMNWKDLISGTTKTIVFVIFIPLFKK